MTSVPMPSPGIRAMLRARLAAMARRGGSSSCGTRAGASKGAACSIGRGLVKTQHNEPSIRPREAFQLRH